MGVVVVVEKDFVCEVSPGASQALQNARPQNKPLALKWLKMV